MNKQRVHTNPEHYARLTERFSPPSKLGMGILRAFWVGGVICMLGQFIMDVGSRWLHLSSRDAGTFVPITGFANAMVSPALEFRREGLVLGLGAKLFTIAGPVLVYGISASVVVGVVYALFLHG